MDQPASEVVLLRNLRSHRPELTALLEECSSHWGFEDPVYRFYHQSFKVYALQNETARIVRVLESLAPDCRLNLWFRQIVEQGTGKSFNDGDNADWTHATRPIVDAFLHAKFFLEMAVCYGTLHDSAAKRLRRASVPVRPALSA